MPAQRTSIESATADREIVIRRSFDAPAEMVFDAWTDPAAIGCWFGPNGFTTTTHEMDARPGGMWRYIMHGPDGTEYDNWIRYIRVDRPHYLEYDHGSGDMPQAHFHVTVTFEERDGQTHLTMRSLFPTAEARQYVVDVHGAIEGGHQTVARLAALVESRFVLSREFDAPREVVFRAWTEAGQLAKWWGPKGCEISVKSLEVRPGGHFHYWLQMPGGMEMWGKFVYREIVPPERLVFVSSFSNPQSEVAPGPFPMDWPLETLNILTLEDADGKTRLTLRAHPYNATEAQRTTFRQGRGSMQQGFGGTFDQLAAYLAEMPR